MKNRIQSAALALALFASTAAQAATFEFSYTFSTGVAVTGSFDGTANGNLVTGLSNIAVFADGVGFAGNGALLDFAWDHDTGDSIAESGVASFDGLSNNFSFENSAAVGTRATYLFAMIPLSRFATSTDDAELLTPSDDRQDAFWQADYLPGSIQSRWRLTAVSAVPEPSTGALLLAGLALLALKTRRHHRRRAPTTL